MCREDLIDFPCSDEWRDWYYLRGLTPYPSATYGQRGSAPKMPQEGLQALTQQFKELAEEIGQVRLENQLLQKRLQTLSKQPIPSRRQEPKAKEAGGKAPKGATIDLGALKP